MKAFVRNYIGKGTQVAGLKIVRMTIKMDEAEEHIYEKDGHRYLTFEISELKEKDAYNRTHTAYVTKIENKTETIKDNLPDEPEQNQPSDKTTKKKKITINENLPF